MVKRVTTIDNAWSFQLIFRISEKPVTKHPKEDFLHLEEKIEEIVELRAEANL